MDRACSCIQEHMPAYSSICIGAIKTLLDQKWPYTSKREGYPWHTHILSRHGEKGREAEETLYSSHEQRIARRRKGSVSTKKQMDVGDWMKQRWASDWDFNVGALGLILSHLDTGASDCACARSTRLAPEWCEDTPTRPCCRYTALFSCEMGRKREGVNPSNVRGWIVQAPSYSLPPTLLTSIY